MFSPSYEKISSTRVDSLATLLLFFDETVRNDETCFKDWWTVWSNHSKTQPPNWKFWNFDVKLNLNHRNILNYLNEENNVNVLVFSDRSVSKFSTPDEKGNYYPCMKPFTISHYKEQFDFSNYVSISNAKPPMFVRNVMTSESEGFVILVIAPGPRTKPWYYHNKKLKMFESTICMLESVSIYNLKYFRDVVLLKYGVNHNFSEIYKTMLQYLKETPNCEYLDVARGNEKLDSFELVYKKIDDNLILSDYTTYPKGTDEPKTTPGNLPTLPPSFTETANKIVSTRPEPIQNFVSCPFTHPSCLPPPFEPATPSKFTVINLPSSHPPMIPTFGERKKPTANYDEAPSVGSVPKWEETKKPTELAIPPPREWISVPTYGVDKYLRTVAKMSKLLPHATPAVREYLSTHSIITPLDEMPAEVQEFVKKLEEETTPPIPPLKEPKKTPSLFYHRSLIKAFEEFIAQSNLGTNPKLPDFGLRNVTQGQTIISAHTLPVIGPSCTFSADSKCINQDNGSLAIFGFDYQSFVPETDIGYTIDEIDKVVSFLTNPRNYDPTFIAKHTLQFKKFAKISKGYKTLYIVAVYYH